MTAPALIYTGGTIGCAGTPLEPLPFERFRALWERHLTPELGPPRAWHWLEPPIDSTEATPRDWLRLARLVVEAGADGPVIVLHGTDTMAWSGAALSLLLATYYRVEGYVLAPHPRPVVLTGSQRTLFDGDEILRGTDAVANVKAAFTVAAPHDSHGVTIAFGGAVLNAATAMKMSTIDDRAFAAPRGEEAIRVPKIGAGREALTSQLDIIEPYFGTRTIIPFLASPAAPERQAELLSAMVAGAGEALGAIHLHGYGIGNFPAQEHLAPILSAAHERGVLIVAGSQTPMGPVDPTGYGAGSWLTDIGAISAGDLPTAAVDARLHMALALGAAWRWSREQMERFVLGVTPPDSEFPWV